MARQERDSLIDALSSPQVTPEGDPGYTSAELCQRTGMYMKTMRGRLLKLKAEGRLTVGKGVRERLDNDRGVVPVYSLKG